MKIVLLIGFAGAAGALFRYGCTKMVNLLLPGGFPWGSLAVNVIGAFTAGFLFVLCRARFQQYENYFPVIFIGFLGAFTTFSTFALESIRFYVDGQYRKFFSNIFLQNVIGLSAAAIGFRLAVRLFR